LFKKDEATGRMIIEDKDEDVEIEVGDDLAGRAYKESLTSVDGFTRGPNGRIKFNKDTKKRRHANEGNEDDDVEMVDATKPTAKVNKKRKKDPKLGHEFKAKVMVTFH
jgi:ribosomal RNA-processing protein 12